MLRCPSCGRRKAGVHQDCPGKPHIGRSDPSPELSISPPKIDGYSFDRAIGHGGYGVVFAGTRSTDEKKLAIKVLRPDAPFDARQRFKREIEALSAIGPPHVPELESTGVFANGSSYAIMELVDLPMLADRLRDLDAPLPRHEILSLALAIVRAIGAAHAKGFVHRDLKPENIFAGGTPMKAKLIDFGMVKLARDGASFVTESGAPGGTPDYMSPEQCEGRPDVDSRADIYSLGVILFELMTTRTPFVGSSMEVIAAHGSQRAPRPSRFAPADADLEAIVLKCLAKDRRERYESAPALEAALSACTEDAPSTIYTKRTDPAPAAAKSTPQRRTMGLLYCDALVSTQELSKAVGSFGGEIAEVSQDGATAVFDPRVREHPARVALRCARSLVAQGASSAPVIDLASVLAVPRAGGGARYLGFAGHRAVRAKVPGGYRGILITPAAKDVLPNVQGSIVGQSDLMAIEGAAANEETRTMMGTLFVGHEGLRREIISSARSAFEKKTGGLATILGDPGYGKSQLAAWMAGEVSRSAAIVHVRATEAIGGDAYPTLRNLLDAALGISSDGEIESLEATLTRTIGQQSARELWPAVALLRGEITPDDPLVAQLAAAPRVLEAGAVRAASELLIKQAERRPIAILLDDAHLAEQAAVEALELATRAEARVRIWGCALARPHFESLHPTFGVRAEVHRTLRLEPLSEKDAELLCRQVLQPVVDVPKKALASIIERTRGIPMLITELVKGLKREGIVRRPPGETAYILATDELDRVPDLPLVEWLTERQLQQLPPPLLAHAGLAAMMLGSWTIDEMSGVLDVLESEGAAESFPLDLRVAVERLIGLEIFAASGDRYAIRHELLKSAIAKSMQEKTVQLVHRAAALYYRNEKSLSTDEKLPRLAHHLERAGEKKEASELCLSIAERLKLRHAYFEAERMFTRSLALLDSTQEKMRLEALAGRGMMRYRLGRNQDALDDFDAALAIAELTGQIETQIGVLLDQAMAHDWMESFHASKDLAERAQSLMTKVPISERSEGWPRLEARLHLAIGRSLFRFADWKGASGLLERAIQEAKIVGDSAYETRVVGMVMLAPIIAILGQVEDAERIFDHVISLCESRGDRLHASIATNNRVMLAIARRDVDEGIRSTERYIEMTRELGMVSNEYRGQVNLAELRYQAGDIAGARPHLSRAFELAARLRTHQGLIAQLLDARLHLVAGDLRSARAAYAEIMAKSGQAKLLPAEELLTQAVDLATRESSDREWDELEARAGQMSTESEPVEVAELRGLWAERSGRIEEARRCFTRALELCRLAPSLLERRIRARLE
jgi:eukaryotic-like serine/threonine-protein kinase